jgi:hypothetical protein
MCGGVVSPVAVAPLWQAAQPLVMPVWLKAAPAQLAVPAWQVEHSAVVATWLLPFPCAPDVPWLTKLPLWQELQAMPLAAAWFMA